MTAVERAAATATVEALRTLPLQGDPPRFRPQGAGGPPKGVAEASIPQTPDELGELISYTYDLTVRRAGELSIPVVGSVTGGFDRRVVVLEWTRYRPVTGDDGVEYRYGYLMRFCLTVSKWDSQARITLPFLTAQAEIGQLQASWMMQVRGLTGSKIDSIVLPPQELKVETFVIARQSLIDAIAAIGDPSTKFIPGTLLVEIDPATPEEQYWLSAVRTFAVDSVRRGWNRQTAQGRLATSDPAAFDVLAEVYNEFGIASPEQRPDNTSRQRARELLGGISTDT